MTDNDKEAMQSTLEKYSKVYENDYFDNAFQKFGENVWNAALEYARHWNVIETDGLPSKEGAYHVTAFGLGGLPAVYEDHYSFRRGWIHYVGITAWRELPEPHEPKEEK